MKEVIYDVIKQNIGNLADFNDDATLIEIGIDSVMFISMIIGLEEEFDIRFEDVQLVFDNYSTIGQLTSMVQEVIEKQKTIKEKIGG